MPFAIVTTPFRRLLSAIGGGRFHPHRYWEARHHARRDSLSAVGHAQLDDETNAEMYEIKRVKLGDMIRRHVANPQGRSLLDAGCGIAMFSSSLVDLGFDVTGVDVSATALERARSREPRATFVPGSLETLSLGRRFDVVVVVDVLLHVVKERAWRSALAALAAHVCPGGMLVILDSMEHPSGDQPEHVNRRSLERFTAALASHGLRRVDHERFTLDREHATKNLVVFRR